MGDDDDVAARPQRRKADDATVGIEHRPPFFGDGHAEIDLDIGVDAAAGLTGPGGADLVDDAKTGAGQAILAGADGERQRAGACGAGGRRLQCTGRGQPQQGDIAGIVAADQRGLGFAAIGQDDRKGVAPGQALF